MLLLVQVILYPRIYSSENISELVQTELEIVVVEMQELLDIYYVAYDSGMIGDNYETKTLTIPAKKLL